MPEAQILAVATALIDEEGAEALTLRTLAARLGSSTSTLYRHFDSRSALIDSVVDGLFGEVHLAVDGAGEATWDVALQAMSTSLFDALQRHPNIAPLMLERIRTTPNVIQIRERVLALLLGSGFSPLGALQAYATVGRYVLGFGVQTRIDGRANGAPPEELLLPVDRFPASATTTSVGPITLAEEFRFGLTMVVIGLQATQGTLREVDGSADAVAGSGSARHAGRT